MPFLLCFVIAAVVTEGVKDALGLGKETAQRAWEKSWTRATESSRRMRAATDRRLRAMRGHPVGRHVAPALAAGSWAARLAGRLGGRGLVFGARATGAVGRGLLLGSAAVAGALHRGARRGMAKGAERYEGYAAKRGKTPEARTRALIDWLKSWSRTVEGEATEAESTPPAAAPQPAAEATTEARPMPGPQSPPPTPVGAHPEYVSEPVATDDTGTVIEGEIVTNPAVPAMANTAEVMGHETAIANMQSRMEQAIHAADIAQQIEDLQSELTRIAEEMAGGQQMLSEQLTALGVTAPNMSSAAEQLRLVAAGVTPEVMLQAHCALAEVSAALEADITDLQARFGHAHETVVSEGIDPAYLAG